MIKRLTADLKSGALSEALADIAEDAARVILPYWRNGVVAETKADDSPVTLADQQAEALILERLEALYPGVQTVAEEAVAADGAPAQAADWFCLIAEGRYDAYPRTGPTSEWDTAAGQAVLEAAGGRVMAEDGQTMRYGKSCFANGG